MHVFKDYCALFFKGALLGDAHGLLVQQTENTQAARQLRFTNLGEVIARATIVRAYIKEALALEKAGVKVVLKPATEYSIPAEFQHQLDADPALHTAFRALTPGRQRACLLHFSAPKQPATRATRVRKWLSQILHGKGLNE